MTPEQKLRQIKRKLAHAMFYFETWPTAFIFCGREVDFVDFDLPKEIFSRPVYPHPILKNSTERNVPFIPLFSETVDVDDLKTFNHIYLETE